MSLSTLGEAVRALVERLERQLVEPTPEELAARAKAEARAADARRLAELADTRGVPRRAARVLVAGGERSTRALDVVRRWWRQGLDPPLLVLAGGVGCGKTFAASWAVAQRPDAALVGSAELALVAYERDRAQELARLARLGLLALDDLGVEVAEPRVTATVDALLDARYRDERPTVVTTNLPAARFRERYGDRIADRLQEGGWYEEIREASLRTPPSRPPTHTPPGAGAPRG